MVLVAILQLVVGGVDADIGHTVQAETRELIPKVWVPDPSGAKRSAHSSEKWYDPPSLKMLAMVGTEMFKTVAAWEVPRQMNVALRVLDDHNTRLMDEQDFHGKVLQIVTRPVSLFVRKNTAKPVLTHLEGVGSATNNAFSIHVRIDNADQIIGLEGTSELVSKRYLNVDGRFFYIGVHSDLGRNGAAANERAKMNEAFLKEWEQNIRRCTMERRLAENRGDEKAVQNAIAQELLAGKAIRESSPQSLPLSEQNEQRKRLQKLLEEVSTSSRDAPHESSAGKRYVRVRGLGGLVAHMLPQNVQEGIGSVVVCIFVVGSALVFVFMIVMLFRKPDHHERHGKRIEGGNDACHCWICGGACWDDDKFPVKMYGNHNQDHERGLLSTKVHHTWQTVEIAVPCCSSCQEEIEESKYRISRIAAIFGIVAFVVVGTVVFLGTGSLLGGYFGAFLAGILFLIVGCYSFKHKHWERIIEYPLIKVLLEKGWQFGEKPSTVE